MKRGQHGKGGKGDAWSTMHEGVSDKMGNTRFMTGSTVAGGTAGNPSAVQDCQDDGSICATS